eukprot:COSAG06_NODE_3451_length_5323_cov_4.349732_7_plen_102_part_00
MPLLDQQISRIDKRRGGTVQVTLIITLSCEPFAREELVGCETANCISFMVTLGPKQLMTASTVLLAMSSAGLITGRAFLQIIDCTRLLFCLSRLFCLTQPL